MPRRFFICRKGRVKSIVSHYLAFLTKK